jgi:magnesium transporter
VATAKTRADVLQKLLRAGVRTRVERVIDRLQPADIAEILPELAPEEVRAVVDVLFAGKRAGRTLREIPEDVLPGVLDVLEDERVAGIVERLAPDDGLWLLQALDEERRPRVEERLSRARREEIERLLVYPESTAGRVMTTRFLAVRESQTAEQAIDEIRRRSEDEVEQVFYLYVVDEERRLRGVVPIRKLVACPPQAPIASIMIAAVAAVDAMADQEEVAAVVAKYNLLAVPVVDASGRLVGVITVDDVIDVIHEEATEDMFRMVGLADQEHVFGPIGRSLRRRLPWMVANLFTAFLAAAVVGWFEASIEKAVALAVFMPVVAGMGGNGGTQTLTIITRGLALGELGLETAWRAIGRQAGIGVLLGTCVGLLTGVAAWVWRGNPALGLVLFVSMVLNMTVAGLSGAAVPLLLRALRQDPALGSGVLVTTFTDAFGFLSFLGIATALLHYMV